MDRPGWRRRRQAVPGGQAVRVDLDNNAVRPAAGNETWLIQLKLTFVFPE